MNEQHSPLSSGETGLGDECGYGPGAVPASCLAYLLTSLTSVSAYCRGQATYRITSLQRKHATRPRIADVPLVQLGSCKLREGAVMSAYCSEVVRHRGESVAKRGGPKHVHVVGMVRDVMYPSEGWKTIEGRKGETGTRVRRLSVHPRPTDCLPRPESDRSRLT